MALIYGAVISREFAVFLTSKNLKFSYPLLAACGYLGLMVWHGGFSGSAPLKAAEQEHLIQLSGISNLSLSAPVSETLFGSMNIIGFITNLLLIPSIAYALAKMVKGSTSLQPIKNPTFIQENADKKLFTAEKLDHNLIPALLTGLLILLSCMYIVFRQSGLAFLSLNYINLLLLGLCFVCHKSFNSFTKASENGIMSAAGILIQFPLYFGIMGLMKDSGLINQLSEIFISWSSPQSFPIFTFFSAAIVNIFVPSGGGQWAIQGPLIIESCQQLGTSLSKSVMALAYGDQITNMLQPFWAFPLLGITGLKAREILPRRQICPPYHQ